MLGHIFPVYYKFKGGKGVLSTATMVLILSPVIFVPLFALFVILVAWTKYVSLGSVSAAILYPVALNAVTQMIYPPARPMMALSSIIIAIVIVWCHRANLERISNKTENKISFEKKTKPTEEVIDVDDEK